MSRLRRCFVAGSRSPSTTTRRGCTGLCTHSCFSLRPQTPCGRTGKRPTIAGCAQTRWLRTQPCRSSPRRWPRCIRPRRHMTPPDLPEPLRAAIARIRDDRDHGASWLAREAAAALAEASAPGTLGNDEERAEQPAQGAQGDALPALWLTGSRPGGEGVALARALAPIGWQITLIADAAVGMFVREAAAVLVGADSIRTDGGVVNKVGTYPLALAAQRAGVPMFVLAESVKIAAPSAPLVLEEMDPRELLPEPVPGVAARNPYFELTPAELVNATITERGRLSRQDIAASARD